MSRLKNDSRFYHYTLINDPFFSSFYTCIFTVIAVTVSIILLLVYHVPNYFIYLILTAIYASIITSGMHESKAQKFQAVSYCFILTLIGMMGMRLMSSYHIAAFSWLLCFSFFAYLTAMEQPLRRVYLAPVIALLPVLFHLHHPPTPVYSPFYEQQTIFNDFVAICATFTLIFLLVCIYPARHLSKSVISSTQSLYLLRNLLLEKAPLDNIELKRLYEFMYYLKTDLSELNKLNDESDVYLKLDSYYQSLQTIIISLIFSWKNLSIPDEIYQNYANVLCQMIDKAQITIPDAAALQQQFKLDDVSTDLLTTINKQLSNIADIHHTTCNWSNRYV